MPDATEAKSGTASHATPADTIPLVAAPIRVRRLKIELHALSTADFESLPRYWRGGSPFETHFRNAFFSTLPFGEAFFVRSVRHYADLVTEPALIEGSVASPVRKASTVGCTTIMSTCLLGRATVPWRRATG